MEPGSVEIAAWRQAQAPNGLKCALSHIRCTTSDFQLSQIPFLLDFAVFLEIIFSEMIEC